MRSGQPLATQGYRVSLAFSTVDQFEVASGVKSLLEIRDTALVDDLGSVLEMHAVIGSEQTAKIDARGRFKDIDTTDQVRVVAYALRNRFFHESGTPWGADATNKLALQALG